jgi:signal peptidase II
LTLFRLVLSAFIVYYIIRLIRDNYKQSYIYCVALILAGAVGNIFDSLFYGVIFGESTPFQIAEFLPAAGGYAPFLQGKVVDMFYFPLFVIPDWIPFLGGEIFFSPIFNLADSAITVGIIVLLLFFSHDFNVTLDTYVSKKKTSNVDDNHA